MSTETVAVQLPQPLYNRLERLAELTKRPLELLVAQTLASSLPPLPDDLPDEMRVELIALEHQDDDALWKMARETAPEQSELLSTLLDKKRHGALSGDEQTILDRLRSQADQLMLRKAYAYVLLKWRGHRLPSLASLEAQL